MRQLSINWIEDVVEDGSDWLAFVRRGRWTWVLIARKESDGWMWYIGSPGQKRRWNGFGLKTAALAKREAETMWKAIIKMRKRRAK